MSSTHGRLWSRVVASSDPIVRAERLNRKMEEREINDLNLLLHLSPDGDAPEAPAMWNEQTQNAFFKGMAWGFGGFTFFVLYGGGFLHM